MSSSSSSSSSSRNSSPLITIPSSALRMLASLLRLPPEMVAGDGTREIPAKWLAQQRQVIDSGRLPAELLSGHDNQNHHQARHLSPLWNLGGGGFVQRVIIRPIVGPLLLATTRDRDRGKEVEGVRLCEAHRGLNEELIGEVYRLIRREVVVCGEGTRSWLRHVGRHEGVYRHLDWGDVGGYVGVMAGVVLLMEEFEVGKGGDEERWEGCFGRGVRLDEIKGKMGAGWGKVGSGCMACVIGVVGGRREMVVGLRASCLSRAKRRTPRLEGRWLGGWLDERGEMERESEALAGRLTAVRGWQSWRARGGRLDEELARELKGMGLSDGAGATCGDHDHHRADGIAEYEEDEGNRELSPNNPYKPPDPRSPSPPIPPQSEPPQPDPFGGFDGVFDSDDEDYRQIIKHLIPLRDRIHNPIPPPTPPSIIDNKREGGYHPPRHSWTTYIPPLYAPRHYPPPRHHDHHPADPNPQSHQHEPTTPPPSSSQSYYADDIYDRYHTGTTNSRPTDRTRSSTIFSRRPRPEEYVGLVTIDANAALLAHQHQKRLDECYSEKSTKGRLKRRLARGNSSPPSEGVSSEGRTAWVDFF
ncbi:hypothetical protein QBC41DRAFT_305472 [Cercophora samala]|uniref:Uncharacterized protein n=1 Tax=Cercophora samala TaxID=330535 RepID=A0AA39Z996_9PEZI|nr:hypothetical protein QBC41DRAFT_305472 [Cercophora samala]